MEKGQKAKQLDGHIRNMANRLLPKKEGALPQALRESSVYITRSVEKRRKKGEVTEHPVWIVMMPGESRKAHFYDESAGGTEAALQAAKDYRNKRLSLSDVSVKTLKKLGIIK